MKSRARQVVFGFSAVLAVSVIFGVGPSDPSVSSTPTASGQRPRQRGQGRRGPRGATPPPPELFDPIREEGQRATGLYMGARFIQRAGGAAVVRAVRRAGGNAAVIDLKDANGRVHHDTHITELEASETGWLGDTRALVQELHNANIYTIARITCFADRRLPERAPERAIQHTRNHRRLWVSWGTGGNWLDPYNSQNHELVARLAREAQELGFDEVQLDYVRFPVDDGIRFAHYPSQTRETQNQVLMRLLRRVDEAITIPLGVDVFGLTAYRRGDPSHLGQDLLAWSQYVEVYTPMLYINSMRNWRRGERNRAFNLVFYGLRRMRNRLGPRPVIRPFLQAFRDPVEEYNPQFIVDQIRAAHRAQSDGYLWWHPGQSYSMVRRGIARRPSRIARFPIPDAIIQQRAGSSR